MLSKKYLLIIIFGVINCLYIFYAYKNISSIDCKSVSVLAVKNFNSTERDSLRFNIARLIIDDIKISNNIQKNSLLLNFDEETITIISQIRVSNKFENLSPALIESILAENLAHITEIYKFRTLNQKINCVNPPPWYQFLSPMVMLLVSFFFILRKKIFKVSS
jgi:hypothetical protein